MVISLTLTVILLKKMFCISYALFRASLVPHHLNTFMTIGIVLVRWTMGSRENWSSLCLVEETDT